MDLQNAVAMEGPIAAAVDASHNTFRVYYRYLVSSGNCRVLLFVVAMPVECLVIITGAYSSL